MGGPNHTLGRDAAQAHLPTLLQQPPRKWDLGRCVCRQGVRTLSVAECGALWAMEPAAGQRRQQHPHACRAAACTRGEGGRWRQGGRAAGGGTRKAERGKGGEEEGPRASCCAIIRGRARVGLTTGLCRGMKLGLLHEVARILAALCELSAPSWHFLSAVAGSGAVGPACGLKRPHPARTHARTRTRVARSRERARWPGLVPAAGVPELRWCRPPRPARSDLYPPGT